MAENFANFCVKLEMHFRFLFPFLEFTEICENLALTNEIKKYIFHCYRFSGSHAVLLFYCEQQNCARFLIFQTIVVIQFDCFRQ